MLGGRHAGIRAALHVGVTNAQIASTFEQVASLLEQQAATAHRVRAWRVAAQEVRGHDGEMADVFHDHGRTGLEAIPGIGPRLANVIIEMVKTGRCSILERLRGDWESALAGVPGIGSTLAARVHGELGVETIEELEAAAHDGRLARVPGFGPRRLAAVRDVLAARLARRPPIHPSERPSVATLLAVDAAYRSAAAAGSLPKISPRRFNPRNEAWLPVMHDERDGWDFTALFSNTALAHHRGRTDDWVIVYYQLDHQAEGQATVVTERQGRLVGRRVVRGRERECVDYYATHAADAAHAA